jgi:hypothetical protein
MWAPRGQQASIQVYTLRTGHTQRPTDPPMHGFHAGTAIHTFDLAHSVQRIHPRLFGPVAGGRPLLGAPPMRFGVLVASLLCRWDLPHTQASSAAIPAFWRTPPAVVRR